MTHYSAAVFNSIGAVEFLSSLICRFPGSRDNSRIRDNVFRFQRRWSERLVTAFGCSKIKKRSMDGNLARLDRRKRKKLFLAERSDLWFRQTALKPGCIVTHRGVVSTSRESYGITDYTFLHFLAAKALSSISQTLQQTLTTSTPV